jgi:hypothetical protein
VVSNQPCLQELLKHDFPGFAKGNAKCCLSNPIDAQYEELLVEETMKASPEAGLCKLNPVDPQLESSFNPCTYEAAKN